MKSYEQIWEILKDAYPITGGKIRIPIATQLETFDVNVKEVISNLDDIINQLFKKKDQARKISETSFSKGFTDLFTGDFSGVLRCDCMFNKQGEIKLIEVNAKRPDGVIMHDNTYSVLADDQYNKNLDLFLQLFNKEEHIFIMYQNAGFIDGHFLEHQKMVAAGYNVSIGTFEDLSYEGEDVVYKGNVVDCLRFSVSPGRLHADQINCFKNKKIKYINTPDMASLGDKSLLQGIENQMIMKTSVLDEVIKSHIIRNKNDYVLKPSNLDEGNGVCIGIETSQEDREKMIEEQVGKNYLVQDYVSIQPKKTSLYIDGKIIEDEFYYDFCPHMFYKKGKLIGVGQILVRYSKDKIVNVLKGGGIGYWKQEV